MSSLTKRLMTTVAKKFPILTRAKHSVWSPDRVVRSPCDDVQIPDVTLDEYMWGGLDKWANKTATVCGITNRSYTYEQMHRQSRSFGAHLRKHFGVQDGDAVAVMMSNLPEYSTVLLGILSAGGVVTTVNPLYTAYELQRQLEGTEAKIIVASPEIVPTIKEAIKLHKKDVKIITVSPESIPEGTISLFDMTNDVNIDTSVLNEVRRSTNDVCLLCYSSGTTGLPKGVQLTHRNMIANCQQQTTDFRLYDNTTATHQDTVLAVLPLYHSYGLSVVMCQKLAAGLKMVTLPRFKPETFLNALTKYKVNLLFAAPPMVLFMGAHSSVTSKHLEHINTIMSGAAPLSAEDVRNVLAKARPNLDFLQGYGLTEAAPLVTISPRGFKDYNSVGFAVPNSFLRIIDSKGKNMGPDEVGELVIKGPNVMKGYKDNPKADKETFTEDGWLRSGDQARIDIDGAVTIADRLKELIKVKGYQVPPAELEAVLKEHPDVLDAAVVGVSDPQTGERPKAFVVLHDGKKTERDSIIGFVKERVAPYKRINDVTFVGTIPKNPSGKILRRVLKEEYCKN